MAKINQAPAQSQSSDARRKAAAFVNVRVLSKDGTSSRQLGGVPLYADNDLHAKIIDIINSDGAINLECDIHVVEPVDNFEL